MKKKQIGVITILLASIMWSIEPIFAKWSYYNSDYLTTSAIRALFATLTALLYIIITKKTNIRITKKNFSILFYISIVGTIFADLTYFYALTQIQIINAVLIGHIQPIFIILIGFLILKQDKPTKLDYIGIAFMIFSGLLVTTKTIENLIHLKIGTIGDLLVLLATIGWATTAIAMRKYLKNLHSGVITFYRFLIASIFFMIYLTLTSNIGISNIYQIMVGIIIGLGTILYYEGLKRLKAAQVSGLELSTPFFATILAFFLHGESITIMQAFGLSLLFIGIYFISRKEK